MTPTDREQPSSKESYLAEPTTGDEYYQRGWTHYAKKEHQQADADFRKALELSPDHPDILYAMGLNLQASGRQEEAIPAFEKVIDLLKDVKEPDLHVRAVMLTRLSHGHINRMKTGDWNLGG
jgi:tetratricopeptide (TPR) repeat protein